MISWLYCGVAGGGRRRHVCTLDRPKTGGHSAFALVGSKLRLKQSKAGRRVSVPVSAALREIVDSLPRLGPIMLTSSEGRPWTSDGFRASFGKTCAKASIDQLTFHDLRGTAVTGLAIAGCTESKIAAITGHSLKSVGEILDRHYLSRDDALGENAMRKLEKRTMIESGRKDRESD